jgi:predicted Rossmann fold flavoprotein
VLVSGGGRCNVTHACFDVERLTGFYPRGGNALRGVFSRFGPADTIRWFEARGVPLKTEADGRMFPVSDDARTIVDCLLEGARRSRVRVEVKRPVERVMKRRRGFDLDGLAADRVILASGGTRSGYGIAAGLGHAIVPPVPSLFTFKILDPRLDGLAGVSVSVARARLEVEGHRPVGGEGPLLITHWGLSGPLVLRLSAWGARALHASGYRGTLLVDLVPSRSQEQVRSELLSRKARGGRKHIANEPAFDLPKRLWQRIVEAVDIPPERVWSEAPQKGLNRLAEMLKRARFEVAGKGAFKEEFVTAGGVPLDEIDLRSMQSRVCPGLWLAGEILDVDALTGGFNFQNAWSTGWIAGGAAASEPA